MPEIDKTVTTRYDKCEKCGYDRGFHVMMDPVRFSDRVAIKLLCPNCGQVFHVGWTIQLEL